MRYLLSIRMRMRLIAILVLAVVGTTLTAASAYGSLYLAVTPDYACQEQVEGHTEGTIYISVHRTVLHPSEEAEPLYVLPEEEYANVAYGNTATEKNFFTTDPNGIAEEGPSYLQGEPTLFTSHQRFTVAYDPGVGETFVVQDAEMPEPSMIRLDSQTPLCSEAPPFEGGFGSEGPKETPPPTEPEPPHEGPIAEPEAPHEAPPPESLPVEKPKPEAPKTSTGAEEPPHLPSVPGNGQPVPGESLAGGSGSGPAGITPSLLGVAPQAPGTLLPPLPRRFQTKPTVRVALAVRPPKTCLAVGRPLVAMVTGRQISQVRFRLPYQPLHILGRPPWRVTDKASLKAGHHYQIGVVVRFQDGSSYRSLQKVIVCRT